MQKQHTYPAPGHRKPFAVRWHALDGASAEAEPLPTGRTRDRTVAIRRVFLDHLGGAATVNDLGEACDALLLLEDLTTMASARETVLKALRPIASPFYGHSAQHLSPVYRPSLPGAAG